MTGEIPVTGRPLGGIRILECGDTLAAAYAGRLLTDLGADVTKVEAAGGDPLRRLGPFAGGHVHPDMSTSFAYFNRGKRSVTAGDGPEGAALLSALAGRADVVLRCTRRGLDWVTDDQLETVSGSNPGLIICDISTFGRHGAGPWPMNDLLALAAGGLLSMNVTDPRDPEAAPLRYRGELASVHAAGTATFAILGALLERRKSGQGQRIDVSAQAAVAGILTTGASKYGYEGHLPVRDGTRATAPSGFFRCRDGVVAVLCAEDDQWERLLHVLGDPEWGRTELPPTSAARGAVADLVDLRVGEALQAFTLSEFISACLEHQVPAAPINYGADLLAWEHLAQRKYFTTLDLTDGSRRLSMQAPGLPWRFRNAPPPEGGASPAIGPTSADPDSVWPERPDTSQADHRRSAGAARPLSGVRVVDLTWAWAGPLAAMFLADLGAEVIKVESTVRTDVTRRMSPYADGIPGVNRSGYFNQYNQGKKSITLNIKDPGGLDLLQRLISRSDIVIDNLRAGALERMGLSYEKLVQLNPSIVAVSITGFGETGPERNRMAYGALIDALSGAAASNGPVGGGPTDLAMALPDPTAGLHTAVATLAALYRTQASGLPERVEVSMLEANLSAFPWPVLFRAATDREAPVQGNRDEERCPHGVYRCRSHDRWLAIAVETDRQFAALAEVIGCDDLGADARFETLEARRRHEDELDRMLSLWAAQRDPHDAAAALRVVGVPAEVVATMDELFCSPPLLERHFFADFPHPEVGVRRLPGVAWTASRSPMTASKAAPVLGGDTRAVLSDLLGVTDEEFSVLERQGSLR